MAEGVGGAWNTDLSGFPLGETVAVLLIYVVLAAAARALGWALMWVSMRVRGLQTDSGAEYERSMNMLVWGTIAVFIGGIIGLFDFSGQSLQGLGYVVSAVGLALVVIGALMPLFWRKAPADRNVAPSD